METDSERKKILSDLCSIFYKKNGILCTFAKFFVREFSQTNGNNMQNLPRVISDIYIYCKDCGYRGYILYYWK